MEVDQPLSTVLGNFACEIVVPFHCRRFFLAGRSALLGCLVRPAVQYGTGDVYYGSLSRDVVVTEVLPLRELDAVPNEPMK